MAADCKTCDPPDPSNPLRGFGVGNSGTSAVPCPDPPPCFGVPENFINLTQEPPEQQWAGNDGQGGTGGGPVAPPTPPTPSPSTSELPQPIVYPSLLKANPPSVGNPTGLEWKTDLVGYGFLISGPASSPADFDWQPMPEWLMDAVGVVSPGPPVDPPSVPQNSVLMRHQFGNALWDAFTPPDPTKAYALGFDVGSGDLDWFEVSGGGVGPVPGWVVPPVTAWAVPVSDAGGAVAWASPAAFAGLGTSAFLTWDAAAVQFDWDVIPQFLLDVLNSSSNPFSFLSSDGASNVTWEQFFLSSTGLAGFPAAGGFLTAQAGQLLWEEFTAWAADAIIGTNSLGNVSFFDQPSFFFNVVTNTAPLNSIVVNNGTNDAEFLAAGGANKYVRTDFGGTLVWDNLPSWFLQSNNNYLGNGALFTPTWLSWPIWFPTKNNALAQFWHSDGAGGYGWVSASTIVPGWVTTPTAFTAIPHTGNATLAVTWTVADWFVNPDNNGVLATNALGQIDWLPETASAVLHTDHNKLPSWLSYTNNAVLRTHVSGGNNTVDWLGPTNNSLLRCGAAGDVAWDTPSFNSIMAYDVVNGVEWHNPPNNTNSYFPAATKTGGQWTWNTLPAWWTDFTALNLAAPNPQLFWYDGAGNVGWTDSFRAALPATTDALLIGAGGADGVWLPTDNTKQLLSQTLGVPEWKSFTDFAYLPTYNPATVKFWGSNGDGTFSWNDVNQVPTEVASKFLTTDAGGNMEWFFSTPSWFATFVGGGTNVQYFRGDGTWVNPLAAGLTTSFYVFNQWGDGGDPFSWYYWHLTFTNGILTGKTLYGTNAVHDPIPGT